MHGVSSLGGAVSDCEVCRKVELYCAVVKGTNIWGTVRAFGNEI